ncbi:hypothetical protein ZWY2020_000190 [Hordeum vulgare]|nr:hypothetical protein ZWY2020_000190 [Hordeum vulgare]
MADRLAVGLAKSVVIGAVTKIQSAIDEDARLRQKVKRDLVFITLEFEMMQSFLDDANEEMKNNLVRTWVKHIKVLAYDVEDCVENVVHLDDKQIFWRRLLPSWLAPSLPLDLAVEEIEHLKGRVEDVNKCYRRYNKINDSASKIVIQQKLAPPSTAPITLEMLAEARGAKKKQQGFGDLTQLIIRQNYDNDSLQASQGGQNKEEKPMVFLGNEDKGKEPRASWEDKIRKNKIMSLKEEAKEWKEKNDCFVGRELEITELEGYSRGSVEMQAEEDGEMFFSELLKLSIFEQVPQLTKTSAQPDTRMGFYQVNGFIHEYIISQQTEENLVFELEGSFALTTRSIVRHLVILRKWARDIIVYKSIDFSRLRSLTVFGKWEPFFISESMKLLRVLDLEDASGVKDADLIKIVKLLRRLKFLSLRGCSDIYHLPSSLGDLRQLQTLDVRGTSIMTLPASITNLQKLQYIRAGCSTIVPASNSPFSCFLHFCSHTRAGVQMPTSIGELTALRTLGVIDVVASGGKAMVKELKKLTHLRKLGVSGINGKNSGKFFSAIKGYVYLESLSIWLDNENNNQGCLDDMISLACANLRSLKLYGLEEKLPKWEDQGPVKFRNLTKLELGMASLPEDVIMFVGMLPELCILRVKQHKAGELKFCVLVNNAFEDDSYKKVRVLEISCSSSLRLTFGSWTMKKLEVLKVDCYGRSPPYEFSGLGNLEELKEVLLVNGSNAQALKQQLEQQLAEEHSREKKPVVKLEQPPPSPESRGNFLVQLPYAVIERYMDTEVLERILDGRGKPTNLSFTLLKDITENFSEYRQIGQGGFSTVYKGVLPNGDVAVKRIRNTHSIKETLFYREVSSLLNIEHENVVRFLGYCASTDQIAIQKEGSKEFNYAEIRERLLCFEHISNGSLQKYITDELRGLEWNTRYGIIRGICEGSYHLHEEKKIFHMDLKPDNILLDNDMVPKITDFGLSRLDEKTKTTSEHRPGTLGYCAPEYLHHGYMSFKSDMYGLGAIIIELVTGKKVIANNNYNNVLRRWRHRWKKSGKETPLVYQQVAKCIEIGLLCQELNPSKRPFIWEIIHDIREIEGVNGQISNAYEHSFGQITPYSDDDMLGIEPLELHFPFELNNQVPCTVQLTNETDSYIAFNIENTSPLSYCTVQPQKDIMSPRSSCTIEVTMQPQGKAPDYMHHANELTVWSTKVNDCFAVEEITRNMFINEEVNVVDQVHLDVVFEAQIVLPQPSLIHCMDMPLVLGTIVSKDQVDSTQPQEASAETSENICTANDDLDGVSDDNPPVPHDKHTASEKQKMHVPPSSVSTANAAPALQAPLVIEEHWGDMQYTKQKDASAGLMGKSSDITSTASHYKSVLSEGDMHAMQQNVASAGLMSNSSNVNADSDGPNGQNTESESCLLNQQQQDSRFAIPEQVHAPSSGQDKVAADCKE